MSLLGFSGQRKLRNRAIAVVLCLCFVISLLPLTYFSSTALDDPAIYITRDGEQIKELVITHSERVPIKAEISGFTSTRFQWQILADPVESLWVDIYDMKDAEAEVSNALVTSLLDGSDSVYIRCTAMTEEARFCSSPLCVTVRETAEPNVIGGLRAPVLSAARAPAAPDDDSGEYSYITINYLSADAPDRNVFTPYVAKIEQNGSYSMEVPSPTQIGFAPFYSGIPGDADPENADASASIVAVNHNPGDGDLVYNVYYKAIDVPYSVKYYFQNVNDDGYTVNDAISFNGMAKTGTIVKDETLNQPVYDYFGVDENDDYGFSPLYHYPESVAADGSTVFECYYDRNYYLIKFDMDGGYGVEPIYARYGASFVVTPPSKAGYVFAGWDITAPDDGDSNPEVATVAPFNFVGTVKAMNCDYKAVWNQEYAKVTIVYWRENANDENYSYWGTDTTYALSATTISGNDNKYVKVGSNYQSTANKVTDLPNALRTDDYNQFENPVADSNVLVEGDGTSIINVFYQRKIYRITLRDNVNSCQVPVHTHTDDCIGYLCEENHVHTSACYALNCGFEEHDPSCFSCTMPEHTHTVACYHTHTADCYHKHDISCYTESINGWQDAETQTDTNNNHIKTAFDLVKNSTEVGMYCGHCQSNRLIGGYNEYHYFFYDGYKWWYLGKDNDNSPTLCGFKWSGTRPNNNKASKSTTTYSESVCDCGKTESTLCCEHASNISTDSFLICGINEHIHGESCYGNCTASNHHVHTDSCYAINCEFLNGTHVHTAGCPRGYTCGYVQHSHTGESNTSKTVKVIEAKYGQDISNEWTFTTSGGLNYPKNNGKATSWTPQGSKIYSQRLYKIDKMSSENTVFTFTETSNGIRYYAYLVECLEGENFDKQYAGKNYKYFYPSHVLDVDFNYYYEAEDFFEIEGFQKNVGRYNNKDIKNGDTVKVGETAEFYYTRNKYTLEFLNADGTVVSSQSVPYQMPLAGYINAMSAELMNSTYYPTTFEPGAYKFGGWYRSPACDAAAALLGNETMPADNYAFYAKWLPVTHTVRFFETYDIMRQYEASVAAGTPDESLVYTKKSMTDIEYTRLVEHGKYVGAIPNPDKHIEVHPDETTTEYDFGGWFLIENEQKKAFTPLDMPITKDLNVYADWGTHTAQPYAVHYILNEYETESAWLSQLGEPSGSLNWKSKTVTSGGQTRRYLCIEDKDTYRWFREIADMTRGYAYQGTTRTFAAKAGETFHQLYTDADIDFNAGYYPTPASHSITMVYEENSLEPVNNVFAFKYVHADNVRYTVRYLDADDLHQLYEPKTVVTTNAVVTERFVPIADYIPDAFYKQCILAVIEDPDNPGQYISSPENVITFYYSNNTTSARYTVHFLLQKADSAPLTNDDYVITFDTDESSPFYGTYSFSDKFEESGSRIDGISDIGTPIKINPINFAGFKLIENKSRRSDGMEPTQDVPYTDGGYTIRPVLAGTDLFIFYERESYPYKVYYLKYETPVSQSDLAGYTVKDGDKVLADTKTKDSLGRDLTALYGTTYSEDAIDIEGYVCVSATTIEKAITPVAANNYIIFFYMPEQYTVQYVVAGGVGGELSKTIETAARDGMEGSTATAKPGYEFVGWFADEACTIPAGYHEHLNPDGKGLVYKEDKMTPASGKEGIYVTPYIPNMIPNGKEGSDTNILYAKFTPLRGDLTINRTNSANEGNGDQVFVYEVKSKTTNAVVYVSVKGNSSVTIKDLLAGDYIVTQMNDWSHRFADSAQEVTVLPNPEDNSVTFDDAAINTKWLNGNGDIAVNKKKG